MSARVIAFGALYLGLIAWMLDMAAFDLAIVAFTLALIVGAHLSYKRRAARAHEQREQEERHDRA